MLAVRICVAAVRDDGRVADKLWDDFISEVVAHKGYHSRQTLLDLHEMHIRSHTSEPGGGGRGRQKWKGDGQTRAAIYANRRRIKGERGRRLLRRRGEFLERSFAHCDEPLLRGRGDASAAPAGA